MLTRILLIALLAAVLPSRAADTIVLKDKASITGRILTEKRDQVVVDVGYTVLLVPRNQVSEIVRDEPGTDPRPPAGAGASSNAPVRVRVSPLVEDADGLFRTARVPLPEKPVRELVQQLGEAVVQVRTPGGLGSGFILNEEGYLITNFHVIEGDTQMAVEVYHQHGGQLDRRVYKQVRIVAMNKFRDLALLKIEDKDAPKFAWVPLGDSDAVAVGERVFAVGSPLGLERTVTEGIISTKTREVEGELYLQTTAQINPGNSGGPLFNLRGEVLGVTNMKLRFGEGLGFAIPVDMVKYFLKHRDAFAYDNDNPTSPYRYLEPPSRLHKNGSDDSSPPAAQP